MGRPRKYTGVLSQPWEYRAPIQGYIDPDEPPDGWSEFLAKRDAPQAGHPAKARQDFCLRIQEYNRQLMQQNATAFWHRFVALFEFFGIEMSDPQSFDDLADRLRDRHLRGLSWHAVRQRYGLTDDNEALDRALKIACEFVPGFKTSVPVSSARFERDEDVTILSAIEGLGKAEQHAQSLLSSRQLARLLLNDRLMHQVLGKQQAANLHTLFKRVGNKKNNGEPNKLSDKILAKYLDELRGIGRAVQTGQRLTANQEQLLFEVRPFLEQQT